MCRFVSRFKVALFITGGKFGLQVKKRAFTEDKTDTQTKITEVLSTSESATKICTTSGAATIYLYR